MNPTQYKKAMQQRALERRVELERAEALPKRSLGATHPAAGDSSFPRGGQRGAVPKVQLQLHGDDSEGGSAAMSFTSSAAGGWSVEGFSDRDQLGELLLHSTEDGLSPLAPGPLADHWSSRDAQLAGFDRQADMNSNSNSSTECSASPGDVWGEDDDELGFGGGRQQQQRRRRRQGVRALDWGDKLPGETSITQGVRLYLSNLYQDASHEDNCALFLHPILERVAREELELLTLKTRHMIKIEAFLRSVVLSVPAKTWQQSVRGAFAMTAPAGMSNAQSPGHGHQTHISKEELTFRMTLFVAMMKAERVGTNDADVAVDALRAESVVRGYAANAAEILPLQRPARTLLPPLLFCMACEVLHVRLLAPEVRHVCRQIVSDYEARAKLWMSPAQNAERFLLPLVTEFLSWLRANREVLYQGSATEGLLRSIDEHLRSSLKNQVYRSPEHFLEVLQSLSSRLTDMPLPSYDPSGGDDHPFDVSQTLKDVSRERFHVNKEPVDHSRCWSRIRTLLFEAAVAVQISKQQHQAPLDRAARPADAAALQTDTGGPRIATDSATSAALLPVMRAEEKEKEKEQGTLERGAGVDDQMDLRHLRSGPTNGTSPSTSPADAAAGGNGCKERVDGGARNRGIGTSGEGAGVGPGGAEEGGSASKSPVELYVDQCTWRVLHAASRTASGGDSFFVVQDLFGGEGVLVKMATALTEPIRIRTKGLAVRVTTVDKHDIYHTSDVDISSEDPPRPLMTITTTMKEIIQFAPPPAPLPFVGTPSNTPVDKSWPTDEGPACALARPQQGQHQQQQQPSRARSGRFITISAALPNYPEGHLEGAAGVLHAQVPSAASMSDVERAPQPPTLGPNMGMGSAIQGDIGASAADSDDANSVASATNGVLRRRPSVFNSPPPAPTPKGWKRLETENSVGNSSWGSAPASPTESRSGDEEALGGDEYSTTTTGGDNRAA